MVRASPTGLAKRVVHVRRRDPDRARLPDVSVEAGGDQLLSCPRGRERRQRRAEPPCALDQQQAECDEQGADGVGGGFERARPAESDERGEHDRGDEDDLDQRPALAALA
jgi:hypothetical protein